MPPRRYRNQQSGIIRTGPYVGRPQRQPTDRTRALALEQVRNLVNGFKFARRPLGRPLNSFVTITWRKTPLFSDTNCSALQTKVFACLSRYLKRHDIAVAFVWTRERVRGVGLHTHALVHLGPKPVPVGFGLRDYLGTKFQFASDGIDIKPQVGALPYLLKGFDRRAFKYSGFEAQNIGAALGIKDCGPQGVITIKRAGCSRSIDAAARKRAGWSELRSFDDLHAVLGREFRGKRANRLVRIGQRQQRQ